MISSAVIRKEGRNMMKENVWVLFEELPGFYTCVLLCVTRTNEETFTFVNELVLSFRCPSLLIVLCLLFPFPSLPDLSLQLTSLMNPFS